MKSTNRAVLYWEFFGVFFIIIFGSLLHFCYEWSNKSPIVGLLTPVNESVWEHLKLGFLAVIIFSLLEFNFIKNKVNNFIIAKALGIIALNLFIVLFFYSYTLILGDNFLILDIFSFIFGAIFCQIISFWILMNKSFKDVYQKASLFFLISLGVLFMFFTFFTPELPIFLDKNTGTYGINRNGN